jgi:threonylcarbamoyladenosine tRNA methylthiotransferase MtaB
MVLFERSGDSGMINGFTGNYIRVEHPYDPALQGEIKKVILKGISNSGNMNIEII